MQHIHPTMRPFVAAIAPPPAPVNPVQAARASNALCDFSEFLAYDPCAASGLVWKVDRPAGVRAGDMAGTRGGAGYYQVSVLGKRYSAHRIIWELHNEAIPDGMQVDHIDRDFTNNVIANLRLATVNQNQSNRLQPLPATGVRGVFIDRTAFVAQVKFKGVAIRKRFKDLVEASAWVTAKRKEVHGDFAAEQA